MADYGKGAARAVLGQGLMMGWGDEAEAWLREKLGQGSYEQNIEKIRSEYGQFSKENPLTSTVGEFAGSALPMGIMAMVPGGQPAAVATGARAVGKLALTGAAQGAVSGAGSATEDSRATGAGGGALLGGALGGTIPLAMRGTSAAAQWLRERLLPSESVINQRAAQKFTQALNQSGMTPQQMEAKLVQDRSMGIPGVVANTGQGLTDLAETVAQRSGQGARKIADTLSKQKEGSRERVYGKVQDTMHPGDWFADEQMMVNDLRSRAKDLYTAAYEKGAVDDPVVNQILMSPTFQDAYRRGQSIAENEALAAKLRGEDPTKYLLPEIYKPTGKIDTLTNSPIMELNQIPNVRVLDYVKRGLDDLIDAGYKGSSSVGKGQASSLKELRNQFVTAIDHKVPEYREARKAYAGDMEVLDAMRTGLNDFNKLKHEQINDMVSQMSQAEKDAFRTGVARNLYDQIHGPSNSFNSAQRIIGSENTQKKLRSLFDNEGQFNLFKAALERESQLFTEANRILGGSQTGKRMQMREAFEESDGVGQVVGQAITGGFGNALTGLTLRIVNSTQMPEKTGNKLAEMLMSSKPEEVASVVKMLEDYAAKAAPKAYKAGVAEAGTVGGAVGTIFPAPLPPSSKEDKKTSIDEDLGAVEAKAKKSSIDEDLEALEAEESKK